MTKHFLNNFLITTTTIICSHIHAVFNYETYSIWQVAITHRRNCIISNPTIDRSFTSTLMTAKESLYIYWSYLPLSKITQSYLYCSQSDAKATKTVVSCRILETNSAMLKIQAAYTTKNTALLTLKKEKKITQMSGSESTPFTTTRILAALRVCCCCWSLLFSSISRSLADTLRSCRI